MSRKTITIAEVGEIRTFGDNGKALPVKGEDGQKYECYRSQLFEHLTMGATVECEVEDKESKDGRFVNHNIKDVSKDGQPVGGQRQGGGGRSYGKSPEIVQFERASIEFNNAMSEAGQRVSESKAPPDIETAYWGHLRRLLRVGLQDAYDATTQAIIATAGTAKVPAGIPQPRTSRDDVRELDRNFAGTVATDTGEGPPFTNVGDFYTKAFKKWVLGPSQIGMILTSADMQDLNTAWTKLAREMGNRQDQLADATERGEKF